MADVMANSTMDVNYSADFSSPLENYQLWLEFQYNMIIVYSSKHLSEHINAH